MDGEHYAIVAIAASAGGVRALKEVLRELEASFPAPILLALHRGDTPSAALATMLTCSTSLRVREAREGEVPAQGSIYVAPGGRHLEVRPSGRLSVQRSGRLNFVCPSADLLLDSVAACYGRRALALVLSGRGRDGADGAAAVRRAGGFVLAQDPHSCEHPGMPASAIETRKVDLVLPLAHLSFALRSIVGVACPPASRSSPSPLRPAG